MSDMRELYQEVIVDHGRHPRNFGQIESPTYSQEGFNPLCGDKLTLYLTVKDNIVQDVKFEGCGCAISMASASLMTEALIGKPVEAAKKLFEEFHQLITTGEVKSDVGKLIALAGVSEYPARVKCATLAWHTMNAVLSDQQGVVTTE